MPETWPVGYGTSLHSVFISAVRIFWLAALPALRLNCYTTFAHNKGFTVLAHVFTETFTIRISRSNVWNFASTTKAPLPTDLRADPSITFQTSRTLGCETLLTYIHEQHHEV